MSTRGFRLPTNPLTYDQESVLSEVDVAFPIHVDVPGALYPEHAVNPGAHGEADEQVGLKRHFIFFG